MIHTDGLSVAYGSTQILKDISLSIPQGQITAIVGPSGCGKSTFLSALNRMTDLIPSASIAGSVMVDCCDIHDKCWSPTELRRCVGMIFQQPNPFPTTIRRNLQLALREHGVRDRQQLEQRTRQALEDVGLWEEVHDRLDRSALHLSGGQQQRLCIARALALQPQVLLMDEPCSSLDPLSTAKLESLILSLRGKLTVLIVTHNLAQAQRISDRTVVFWVRDGVGQVIEEGDTKTVFASPNDPTAADYLAGRQG